MKKYFFLAWVVIGAAVWQMQDVKVLESQATPAAAIVETVKQDFPYVEINDTKIPVEIVKTPAEVQKGLSGRESLAADKGMLFVFNKPDYYRFWMPNMNFPIDIIWIAQDTIIGIHPNVSNIFDPKNPKFYTPPEPVDRVLEVNINFAQNKNIKVGHTVFFNNVDLASSK